MIALAVIVLSSGCRVNELAVGNGASLPDTDDHVSVPINNVENYNFLSREKILALRTAYVAKFPQLLSGQYQPSDRIFLMIKDGKPWWGTRGIFINGSGVKSIEGEAEESRFLSNPFLLVGASPRTAEIWNKKTLPDAELKRSDFPLYWQPTSLTYYPKRQLVDATYDISSYDRKIEELKSWLNQRDRNELPIRQFGLVGYNARDFGYEYIYVPIDQSNNIANKNDPKKAVDIGQFIHCGDGCGYPGGCNNMSPERPPIDRFSILKLPATVKIFLWKSKPKSSLENPDMTVTLNME